MVPFLPLTFIVAYLGDMAYGTKMKRIRGKTSSTMQCLLIIY